MNINLKDKQNRHLLQPVDIWVERTIKTLANDYNLTKKLVAKWIVNNSIQYNLNPERINMGIWFFSSEIVGSEYRLNNMLKNLNEAKNLVNDFKRRVRRMCKNC